MSKDEVSFTCLVCCKNVKARGGRVWNPSPSPPPAAGRVSYHNSGITRICLESLRLFLNGDIGDVGDILKANYERKNFQRVLG